MTAYVGGPPSTFDDAPRDARSILTGAGVICIENGRFWRARHARYDEPTGPL